MRRTQDQREMHASAWKQVRTPDVAALFMGFTTRQGSQKWT